MTSFLPSLPSHFLTSRLISYGTLTAVLSSFALWRYMQYYHNSENESKGVNTIEHIMQDNFIVVAAFNMVFCFLLCLVKAMQYFFFGTLGSTEPEFIREKLAQFVLSRAVFLIGIINATKWSSLLGWTFWFGCFCCFYGFARLARSRCENLLARQDTSKRDWLRFCIMLFTLSCGVGFNLAFGLKYSYYLSDVVPDADLFGDLTSNGSEEDISADIYQIGHVLVYMVSDSILVNALIWRILFIIGIHALDEVSWASNLSFEKSRWLYNVNLIFDIANFTLHFLNHVHMLIWTRLISLITPIICIQIFVSYGCLARRIHRHFAYMEHVKAVRNEFPLECFVSNTGGSEIEIEQCSICWEPLRSWRRLPCQHRFHEACLTTWIEQDPSCPACRRRILPQISYRQPRTRQQAFVGTLMRDLFSVFDSDPVEQITPPTAETQSPIRNIYLRLRSRGTPGYDLSIRITLGPGRRLLRHTAQVGRIEDDGQDNGIPLELQGNVTRTDGQSQEEQVIQSTTRTRFYRFDGSRYSSWLPIIDIEFSETEQHVASPGVTATFAMEQHQRQGSDQRPRLLTRFRPITHRSASQTQPFRPLTTSLRAQGEQIAAAFPDLPLNVIFHDLAITRIPEVTVENILAGRISRNIDEGAIRFEYETSNQIAQRNASQSPDDVTTASSTSAQSSTQNNNSELNEQYPEPPPLEPQDIESMSPSDLLAFRRRQLLFRARNRFNAIQRRPWNRALH
ncbi:unnamed protein product [Hymenolepis diminuta]|uniref:RING-type domain-containing protein n=1 Tax=Hymenolepis diminuta TaxID=6216 RepID=A0A564Z316_HYMDI|nr:unnamed protein product [Hymenolepis diminuta]